MTLDTIAGGLASLGGLDRPVVDRTGLAGSFDFGLNWVPEPTGAGQPDLQGTTFVQALRDQLGLKLEATKVPVQIPVIDRVERPSEN
jgi:uncharacterized protein (TIGR03435 family)